MFSRKKHTVIVYEDDFIEHILGYVLSYRGDIIPNSVFVDKEHELNGIIGFHARKLSDELDFVALQYVYRFFIGAGVSVERLNRVLLTVLDRFIKDNVIKQAECKPYYDLMVSRVCEYLPMKAAPKIGMAFMTYVVEGHNVLADDTGRYIAPILKTLETNIYKIINMEFNAGR